MYIYFIAMTVYLTSLTLASFIFLSMVHKMGKRTSLIMTHQLEIHQRINDIEATINNYNYALNVIRSEKINWKKEGF